MRTAGPFTLPVEPAAEALPAVPGSELGVTVRGYEVVVRACGDTVRVTCPELPQLSVSDATLIGVLALAEDVIAAILAGEFERTDQTR